MRVLPILLIGILSGCTGHGRLYPPNGQPIDFEVQQIGMVRPATIELEGEQLKGEFVITKTPSASFGVLLGDVSGYSTTQQGQFAGIGTFQGQNTRMDCEFIMNKNATGAGVCKADDKLYKLIFL